MCSNELSTHVARLRDALLMMVIIGLMLITASGRTEAGGVQFGPQQVIPTSSGSALSVYAADLDGDGDPDVLSASYSGNYLAWYENVDGLGEFGPQQVIPTWAPGAYSVFAADLDGDGDLDVLSASSRDDKIAWYENLLPPPPVKVLLPNDGVTLLGDSLIKSNGKRMCHPPARAFAWICGTVRD
jgi:hypothetical protein